MAHNPDLNPNFRNFALKSSYGQLEALCKESPHFECLCSVARIAREIGYREKAFKAVGHTADIFTTQQSLKLDEPFLPASQRFDNIDSDNRFGAWMKASLLEQSVSKYREARIDLFRCVTILHSYSSANSLLRAL